MNAARLALLALVPLLSLPAQEIEVRSHTLANGMRLLIHEDHDIPNVALYLFFRVGSRNEQLGTTGISHFFEHMMFNGAKKYGPKQFDIQMERAGGRNNAYTSRDVTVYTDWFPRTALELMFDMEADRMVNLAIEPAIIESERGVVYSERRTSVDNSNFGSLFELLGATAYVAHPYQFPVIGWPSDIESWTLDDLRRHYRMGYAPNNCVAVVAGDITEAEVLALAKKHFEPLPRQDPPPAVRTKEPPQRGERRVELRKAAQLPIQLYSYHVPETRHADAAPLEVLAAVLSQGQSSRLYRRLVDGEQVAISASASTDLSLDPGQFTFVVRPRAGVETARAERELYAEVERLRTADVPADELRKAKNQLLADLYRELKTIAGKANLLGQYEVFHGDHRRLSQAASRIEAVTAADVRRVAQQHLQPTNRTVAVLIPEAAPASAPTEGAQ